MFEPALVLKFVSVFYVIAKLKEVHGITLSVNISGNNVQLTTTGHHNESRLPNITSNELTAKTTAAQTTVIKTRTTNIPKTRTIDDMLDGYEGGKASSSNLTTSASTQLITTTQPLTRLSTHVENHTTVSPPHGAFKHHFNMKTLDYILIPVGCLLAIVILYFLVRHVQKVRRKRRLERELLHQYSYPNSEADDMEEHNIGDIESVINAQFVSFSDRSDKNLYEDSPEVNLAFDETSKLVVQEPPPGSPEEREVSTSFTS